MITRRQALAAGMTADAVKHAIRPDGPWTPVLTGVYATFTGHLSDLQRLRAAVLYAGTGAMVTGAWGCWMLGLRYGPAAGDEVDVLLAQGSGCRSAGFVRVVRTARVPTVHWWIDEARLADLRAGGPPLDVVPDSLASPSRPGIIPMAPAARVVVDALVRADRLPPDWRPSCSSPTGCPACGTHRVLALRNARAVMCEVVQRRIASLASLRAQVRGAPRRGGSLVREAMADIDAGCRSAPECELRDLIRRSAVLPEPRWNQRLPGARGIVPDACWPQARLVVEVDSRSWHGFGDAPRRTEQRRAKYAALGWRVLPVAPARIRADAANVLREIEAAYLVAG